MNKPLASFPIPSRVVSPVILKLISSGPVQLSVAINDGISYELSDSSQNV